MIDLDGYKQAGAAQAMDKRGELDQSEHPVQFYESDEALADSVSGLIAKGLAANSAGIVVATKEHRLAIEARLRLYGLDLDQAAVSGQYVALDAAQTLASIMVDGSVSPSRFGEVVGELVMRSSEGRSGVRVFGEMVALLWAAGNHEASIQLELLWDQLREIHSFVLLCAYPTAILAGDDATRPLIDICTAHSKVISPEGEAVLSTPDEKHHAASLLQQRARSLQEEMKVRRQAEELLRVSELCYRRYFEEASDGLLIVDPRTQKITSANPAILSLLGFEESEALGKELWEVGLLKDKATSRDTFRELAEKLSVRHDGMVVEPRIGKCRYVDFSSHVYVTEGHQVIQCNIRDVTDRKRADEVASHLAAIVESSDDAIISKSLEGTILSWNRGAERIFGYSALEVIGKNISILIPPERIEEEPVILARLRAGKSIDHYDTIRVAKDGHQIYISLTVSPIRDRNGTIIGASKIARDVTERKRAEDERERLLVSEQMARVEAENANRMKDEFLATVSHELRTPLNAIIGWSHMLQSGGVDPETSRRAIATIERNARSQAQLIEDILDVSRAITGRLRLNIGLVDIASVINATIDSVQLAADSKGIQLAVTLDPSARHVSGDSSRLQQVVWNLISNAIKFTPSGGQVEVRLKRADSFLQITVSDNGQGIKADFLPFLFERFRQADGTSTRRHGGLGLGLAIVRNLVELHGGTVEAQSEGEGRGATFTVNLPLATTGNSVNRPRRPLDRPSGTDTSRPGPLPTLEGIKVLLVDDDPDTLQLITVMLTEQRATVQAVSSAAEALETLVWYRPDVLVSDLAMPYEDGYSLIDKVRKLDIANLRHTPAVALTAYVRVEDRARALSAGFNMFVPKPVEFHELITSIASLSGVGR